MGLVMDKSLIDLDKVERQILAVLQSEGRLTNQQLAERVQMSPAACWRRVKQLEQRGIISNYAAILDRKKAGFNFCIFMHVSLSRHNKENVEKFEQAMKMRPEVLECYATTGDSDFILRVVAQDIESYDRFLEEFVFGLPGISQVKSSITLREIKFDTKLPL